MSKSVPGSSRHSATTLDSKNGRPQLSSAVSSLVRAQYGLSARENKGDSQTDLDRHVADLLLKEAQDREARAKASNSPAWSFSDDEDGGSGKQFSSKTNKRFLKSMLRGVEDHNAPLRRQEVEVELAALNRNGNNSRRSGASRGADRPRLAADARASSASASPAPEASTERKRGPPGFAARTLAMGLSGALSARQQKHREEKDLRTAVEDAKARAGSHSQGDRTHTLDEPVQGHVVKDSQDTLDKGKRRQVEEDFSEEEKDHRQSDGRDYHQRSDYESSPGHSRRRSSRERTDRLEKEESERTKRSKRHRSDRSRSRSRSPRHHSDGMSRTRYSDSKSHDDSERGRSSEHRRSRHRDTSRDARSSRSEDYRSKPRSSRRASESADDTDQSSDTFVDYTGASPHDGAGDSKMDKYFSKSYDPALDVNVADLEDPQTGLIAEGNFSGWDQMLNVLKKRKEDKVFGVSRAREEERESQLRKLERRKEREERRAERALRREEKHRAKRKKRRRSSREDRSSNSDSEASDAKAKRSKSFTAKDSRQTTTLIDGHEYGKRGAVRAWDLGKEGF